jgi:hypothetical protein
MSAKNRRYASNSSDVNNRKNTPYGGNTRNIRDVKNSKKQQKATRQLA